MSLPVTTTMFSRKVYGSDKSFFEFWIFDAGGRKIKTRTPSLVALTPQNGASRLFDEMPQTQLSQVRRFFGEAQ